MKRKAKREIKYSIIIITTIATLSIITFLYLDNSIQYTGEVRSINYENNSVKLYEANSEEFIEVHNIPEEIINNIDTGCVLNIYFSGRVEIVGICAPVWIS